MLSVVFFLIFFHQHNDLKIKIDKHIIYFFLFLILYYQHNEL